MKHSIKALVLTAAMTACLSALAHGDPSPAKYGGIVAEAKDLEFELVATADSIAIYVDDHEKKAGTKVDTKGATAKVTLLGGGQKTEVNLTPAGGNKLEAKGAFKIAAGTKAVSVVTLAGKPAVTVRFEVK